MADVFGLSDVSTKDTGSGSKLKTGNLKRSHNMPGEKACNKYKGKEKQDCLNYRGRFAKMKKSDQSSKKKPIKKMSEKQSKSWSNYMRQGSFYYDQADSSEKAMLDSLMQSKLKKIK